MPIRRVIVTPVDSDGGGPAAATAGSGAVELKQPLQAA